MATSPRPGGSAHGPIRIDAQNSAISIGDGGTATNSVRQVSVGVARDDLQVEVAALLTKLARMMDDGTLQTNGLDGRTAADAVGQLNRIEEELDADSTNPGAIRRAVGRLTVALAGVEAVSASVQKIVEATRSVFGGP